MVLMNEAASAWPILPMSCFIPESKAVGIMEKDHITLEEESNYT